MESVKVWYKENFLEIFIKGSFCGSNSYDGKPANFKEYLRVMYVLIVINVFLRFRELV